MALVNIPIPETQCIGDSLDTINTAFQTLDNNLTALGAQVLTNKNDLWLWKNGDYTASVADKIAADTDGGSWVLYLPNFPNTPPNEGWIQVIDAKKCWDQPGKQLIVAPGTHNGFTIEGVAENLVCNSRYSMLTFVYTGFTWRVYV